MALVDLTSLKWLFLQPMFLLCMYTQPQKKFRAKKIADIEAEILSVVASGQKHQRVFLADGDAMTLPFKRLKEILLLIRKHMPHVQRVSAYCLPRNIKNKSLAELYELRTLGLGIVLLHMRTLRLYIR